MNLDYRIFGSFVFRLKALDRAAHKEKGSQSLQSVPECNYNLYGILHIDYPIAWLLICKTILGHPVCS